MLQPRMNQPDMAAVFQNAVRQFQQAKSWSIFLVRGVEYHESLMHERSQQVEAGRSIDPKIARDVDNADRDFPRLQITQDRDAPRERIDGFARLLGGAIL